MREEQNRLAKIESAVHEANLLRIYAKVMISTYDDVSPLPLPSCETRSGWCDTRSRVVGRARRYCKS